MTYLKGMAWVASLSILMVMMVTCVAIAEPPPVVSATEPGFVPEKEAELPQGFPPHTKVGAIELRQYPAYRKATSAGSASFWELFRHISSNKIKMTAPVEVTYGRSASGAVKEDNMAFLYGTPDLGSKGTYGAVEVTDVPAATVVSTGVRGARNEASMKRALERLREWLEANKAEFAEAGPPRVMAYNSPFIPRERQFFEVQIPVKPLR